ncbi:hypothetical protein [Hahella ganghwensis]|uniref:hypothetical protein n=1 Tax=Hahella ganghwensis TaxID=286420 RepID=UPI000380588C|nr:hypothetical protein [Hahella ganghwensis]
MKSELFNPHKVIALRLAGLCQSDLSWIMSKVGESDRAKINKALLEVKKMGISSGILKDRFSQILKAVEHQELLEEEFSEQINVEKLNTVLSISNEFDSSLIWKSLPSEVKGQLFGNNPNNSIGSHRSNPSDKVRKTVMEFLSVATTERYNQ